MINNLLNKLIHRLTGYDINEQIIHINELEEQRSLLHAECKKLKSEKSDSESEASKLIKSLKEYRDNSKEQKEEIKKERCKISELEGLISFLNSEYRKLNSELIKSQTSYETLNELHERDVDYLAILKEEAIKNDLKIKELEDQNNLLNLENNNLTADKSNTQAAYEDIIKTLEFSDIQLNKLNTEITELKQGNQKRSVEISQLIDNNHKLTEEVNSLKVKLKHKDNVISELKAELNDLKETTREREKENESIQATLKNEEELKIQREESARVILEANIKKGEELINSIVKKEIDLIKTEFKYQGLIETDLEFIFENFNETTTSIKWIYDAEIDKYFEVLPEFFNQDEGVLINLRLRLEDYASNNQGKPKFVCAVCYEPVILLGVYGERGKVNCFVHKNDNINCPIKTGIYKNTRAFIESRKYQNSASSYWTALIRKQLEHILPITKGIENCIVEPIVNYNFNFAIWRKPHFTCNYNKQQIAIEVQTNPTNIKVISSRNLFYRKQDCFILWIFDDSFADSKSLSMKDIFYANNRNIFVYDKKANEMSQELRELHLKCIWEEPYKNELDKIVWSKKSSYITLDELTFNEENHIVYFYPSEERYLEMGGTLAPILDTRPIYSDYEATFEDLKKTHIEKLNDIKSNNQKSQSRIHIVDKSSKQDSKIFSEDTINNRITDYDISFHDNNGYFICRQDNRWYKVERETLKGELLIYTKIEEFLTYLKGTVSGVVVIMDYQGTILHSFKCDKLELFMDNQILVVRNLKYGWYNNNFQTVLPVKYDLIEKFNDNLVLAKIDSWCSLYYPNGQLTSINPSNRIKIIDEDNLLLYANKQYVIYSLSTNRIIIGPSFQAETVRKGLQLLTDEIIQFVIERKTFLYGTLLADKGDYYDVKMITIKGYDKLYKKDVTEDANAKYQNLLKDGIPIPCKVVLVRNDDNTTVLSQSIAMARIKELERIPIMILKNMKN